MSVSRNVEPTSVRGVTLHRLTVANESRGTLVAGEFGRDIPFEPKRVFMVFDVPGAAVRGEHAHRTCRQFLVAIRGAVSVVVDDGSASEEIRLSEASVGLYVPALTWGIQQKYSDDALLLVFASEHYDTADYIRDYDEFKRLVASR